MTKYICSKGMKLGVKNKGAELFSVIVDETEFMWNKQEVWAKSSPILFPFVGVLKDSMYKVSGKEYFLDTRHGFARDMVFENTLEEDNKLVYSLSYSEETLKKYPYKFKFTITYEILEKNKLQMSFVVENQDNKDMYFSLGAHPAFLLEGNYEDYYIKIDEKQDLYKYVLEDAKYLGEDKKFFATTDKILINDQNFIDDAIVFDGDISKKSIIESKNSSRKIVIEHENYPYIAYWRPLKANFVCVEPWYGITDRKLHNNNIEEKLGIEKLKPAHKFESKLIFTFEK